MAENPKPAPPDSETPFQRFPRLAKKVVTAPKPPTEKPGPQRGLPSAPSGSPG